MESRETVQLDLNYQTFKPITALQQEIRATAEEISFYRHELKQLRNEHLQNAEKIKFDAAVEKLKYSFGQSLAELNTKYKNLLKLTEDQYFEDINAIKKELEEVYHINLTKHVNKDHQNGEVRNAEEANCVPLDENEIRDKANTTQYPRAQYLLERYITLKQNQSSSDVNDENSLNFFDKLRAALKRYFNVFKKVIDGTDDTYAAIRNVPAIKASPYQDTLNLLTPILVGSVGVIINFAEAFLAHKRLVKAEGLGANKQKRTRILAAEVSRTLGITGGSLAILSIIAGVAGLTLGGFAAFLPFLVPCFPLMIYATELARKSYTLNQTTAREKEAKKVYEDFIANANNRDQLVDQDKLIRSKESEIIALQNAIKKLDREKLVLIKNNHSFVTKSEEIKEKEAEYNRSIDALNILKQQEPINRALELKQIYETRQQERLKAERKVSMNVIELIGTTLVVTGVGLGTAAIFGVASVASFGILPLSLIISGIALGFALKIFGVIDDKFDNKITKNIRDGFVYAKEKMILGAKNLFKPVLNCFPAKKVEPTPTENIIQPILSNSTQTIINSQGRNTSNHQLPSTQSILIKDFDVTKKPKYISSDDQVVYEKNGTFRLFSTAQVPPQRAPLVPGLKPKNPQ